MWFGSLLAPAGESRKGSIVDRRPCSDLGLIYAMLRHCGIRAVDLADLGAYEVVEITDDNGDLFDCYLEHGPGLTIRFRSAWVGGAADLAEARRSIEDAAQTPITLVRRPHPHIPDRWVPVPVDHPELTGTPR